MPMDSIETGYEKKYEAIIKSKVLELFRDTEAIIFLFGSRAKGDYKKGSDYDIGFESIDYDSFRRLKMQFDDFWEESIVPHKVDLVYFDHAESGFREIAKRDIVIWKTD